MTLRSHFFHSASGCIMSNSRGHGRQKLLALSLGTFLFLGGCAKNGGVNSETARQMISHRNLGLAYLEEGQHRDAADEFQKLVEIAPEEPLGYANLGLAYLRMAGELEQSEKWLLSALRLKPEDPDISLLLTKVYELTQRESRAVSTLETVLKKHPDHVRTLYQLALYYTKMPDPKAQERATACLAQVVNAIPANVAARLRLIELLLRGDRPGDAIQQMETIRQTLPELPQGSVEIFRKALELMRNGDAKQAFTPALMFHNLMKPTSFYQASLTELRGTGGPIAGAPIYRFSQLASLPRHRQTGIPETLTFNDVTDASGLNIVSVDVDAAPSGDNPLTILAEGDHDGDGDQDLFVSRWLSGEKVSRHYLFTNDNGAFSDIAAEAGISHPGRNLSALFADYDNDGYLDMFVVNSKANKLYHNSGESTFQDVTASAGIETTSEGRTALFADLDLEGDLDLFLGTTSQNRLYRNNLDGTFAEIADEAGIDGEALISRDAAFGDFDDDGDIDLLVVNEDGSNRYFDNLRQSYFRDITTHAGLTTDGGSGAVAAGDYDNDGYLDLFVTDLAGERHLLLRNQGDGTFEQDDRSHNAFESIKGFAGLDAVFFDADNDGFLDLLAAGSPSDENTERGGLKLFYNRGDGTYLEASSLLPDHLGPASQVEVSDYDNDGDLDIFVADIYGGVHLLRNDGGNVNNFLVVRLAGLRTGSTKNNYFGIGAKVEVKAGDLYQMKVMSDPVAHFGLGNRDGADVVRVVWSNGVPQNRFNPERNQTVVETQILKGSCPWLYVWNGIEYEFATDALWASALGMPLRIMAGEPLYAFPNSASEHFKLPSGRLKPKGGKYSLQFTTELWETPYLDQVRLIVVDHPDSVDIFVDETFTPPPFPPFRIYAVTDKRQPVSARDDRGNDVLEKIAHADGDYVSNLTPAMYQGVMEHHDLILDLGDLSGADSVFLFLYGWLFPTDASINMNMAQSAAAGSVFPLLQVIDDEGNWKTVIENLSFPKGKNKTLVVELTNKFLTHDYRIRIRTNMQIYWDHIFYSTDVSSGSLRKVRLDPVAADLHYRGFSELTWETPYSPSIPDYQTVSTEAKWRDLTGFYTRYGDVLPLLLESDSKYVVMNAGDEVTLEFDAEDSPELPSGWSRDFLFYNNGWLKDGDLNTAQGQTVELLPFHGMSSYPYGTDEAYPDDEESQSYLKRYNSRQVTAEAFKRFLFNFHAGN